MTKYLINKPNTAAVVLSEFAGSSKAVGGILKANPFNFQDVVEKINEALQLKKEEKLERFSVSQRYLKKTSTLSWAQMFLKDLKTAHEPVLSIALLF